MIEGQVTVLNTLGLHARAAAEVVRTATEFESEMHLCNGEREVSAKSIMGVMMLAATKGTALTLRVEGEDEDNAYLAMEESFARCFGEER